jgi:hypothetical protein
MLTFIDDLSRKIWVYFLMEKSETFGVFKEFKALVEKQAGVPIQILRTDKGESIFLKSLLIFAMNMVFNGNLLLHIRHNKMA